MSSELGLVSGVGLSFLSYRVLTTRSQAHHSKSLPVLSNIMETARWTAAGRVCESERADALFRDVWARHWVEGISHPLMTAALNGNSATIAVRTHIIDQWVQEAVASGIKTVINLAAGFDMRPYRLEMPPDTRWVEIDKPDILTEKLVKIHDAQPCCQVDRYPVDLCQPKALKAPLKSCCGH